MSKIEAGRIHLDPEDLDTRFDMLAESMRVVSTRAEEKRQTLSVADILGYHPAAPTAARIKQIALNLLSNAVKFTPAGGHVTVRGRRASSCILDQHQRHCGIGIAKEALQKLGRPFEQVESQLTKTHQGSGSRPGHLQIAGGTAWRPHAHPFAARHRNAWL